jgi:hypothetical protein
MPVDVENLYVKRENEKFLWMNAATTRKSGLSKLELEPVIPLARPNTFISYQAMVMDREKIRINSSWEAVWPEHWSIKTPTIQQSQKKISQTWSYRIGIIGRCGSSNSRRFLAENTRFSSIWSNTTKLFHLSLLYIKYEILQVFEFY